MGWDKKWGYEVSEKFSEIQLFDLKPILDKFHGGETVAVEVDFSVIEEYAKQCGGKGAILFVKGVRSGFDGEESFCIFSVGDK